MHACGYGTGVYSCRTNVPHTGVSSVQDMLVQDADLRQSASELGLRIAERFHQDVIAEVCINY